MNNNGGVVGEVNTGTAAILARLKELELSNQQFQGTMEHLKSELQSKDEKIKSLSADKRKDMEQMIESAIDNWLNSLTGVSEDVRKQFRQGISKIAEQADMQNSAWEIVCNASKAHTENVKKIEDLIKTCNDQGNTIKSLIGNENTQPNSFLSEESRISGYKRPRTDGNMMTNNNNNINNNDNGNYSSYLNGNVREGGGENNNTSSSTGVIGRSNNDNDRVYNNNNTNNNNNNNNSNNNNNNAWDLFSKMLSDEGRGIYY